ARQVQSATRQNCSRRKGTRPPSARTEQSADRVLSRSAKSADGTEHAQRRQRKDRQNRRQAKRNRRPQTGPHRPRRRTPQIRRRLRLGPRVAPILAFVGTAFRGGPLTYVWPRISEPPLIPRHKRGGRLT